MQKPPFSVMKVSLKICMVAWAPWNSGPLEPSTLDQNLGSWARLCDDWAPPSVPSALCARDLILHGKNQWDLICPEVNI